MDSCGEKILKNLEIDRLRRLNPRPRWLKNGGRKSYKIVKQEGGKRQFIYLSLNFWLDLHQITIKMCDQWFFLFEL